MIIDMVKTWDGTEDPINERSYKIEFYEEVLLDECNNTFVEGILNLICVPFVPNSVPENLAPVKVEGYNF